MASKSDRKLAVGLLLVISGALWYSLSPSTRTRRRTRATDATDAARAATMDPSSVATDAVFTAEANATIPPPRTSVLPPADDPFYSDWRGPDAIQAHLAAIARRYNKRGGGLLVTLETIGRSHEKRPIVLLKATARHRPPRNLFVLGGQHGREWISPMATVYAVHALLHAHAHAHARGDRSRSGVLRGGVAVHAVPLLNPDGLAYSMSMSASKAKRGKKTDYIRRMWRKNRRPDQHGSVDLNRNWGTKKPVFAVDTKKAKGNPLASGPRGFSEPETDAVRRYFAAQPAAFDAFADVHCCMHCVLGPHSFTWGFDDEFEISDAVAARQARVGAAMAREANAVAERQSQNLLKRGMSAAVWDVIGFSRYSYRKRTKTTGATSNNAVSPSLFFLQ